MPLVKVRLFLFELYAMADCSKRATYTSHLESLPYKNETMGTLHVTATYIKHLIMRSLVSLPYL